MRFFDDLEYLFDRAMISSEADKKRHILRYVDFDTEQGWKSLPEYSNATASYTDFKHAILYFYPDAFGDSIYSLHDLELLISSSQRLSISTTSQLAEYHMQFLAITSWLIRERQLADLEQRRSYITAFSPALSAAISHRLQFKFIDHHPNIPHQIQDIHDAACFILRSSLTASQSYYPPLPLSAFTALQPLPPAITDNAVTLQVEKDDISTLLCKFTRAVAKAINQDNQIQPIVRTASMHMPHIPHNSYTVTRTSSSPLPVISPQQYAQIATLEAEISMLRSRNQDIASSVRTSAQKAGEARISIPDENAASVIQSSCYFHVAAHIQHQPFRETSPEPIPSLQPASVLKRPFIYVKDTAYTPPVARNFAPLIAPIFPDLHQIKKSAVTSKDLSLSAPSAPGFSSSPDVAPCYSEFVFDPGSPLLPITACHATCDQTRKLALECEPQCTISSKFFASSLSQPLQPPRFKVPSNFSFSLIFSTSIVSPIHFLHVACEGTSRQTAALNNIAISIQRPATPPLKAHFIEFHPHRTYGNYSMFYNTVSAVLLIAETFAPLYTAPDHVLHLVHSASPTRIYISSALLSMLGITLYGTRIVAFRSIFDTADTATTSQRPPKPKPDKAIPKTSLSLPCRMRTSADSKFLSALISFMTEDSQY